MTVYVRNPETQRRTKRRYYAQAPTGENNHRRWSAEDDATVLARGLPDRELAHQLGRSIRSIEKRRLLLRNLPTVDYDDDPL